MFSLVLSAQFSAIAAVEKRTVARILLGTLLLFAGASPCAAQTNDFHAGLLYDEFPLTLDPGYRIEALGPLFYHQQSESETIHAFPPVLSLEQNPATASKEFDLVYPIFTYERYGTENGWQLGQLLNGRNGQDPDGTVRKRFTLFPLYFQQRSTNAAFNYTALVPFYGHLRDRLFRDDIFFVMFPLYSETRKADVVTDNYVYPIFDLRHGEKLWGWQVWPLVGREHKDVTTRTNGFGDVSIIGGHQNFFLLWPFYFDEYTGIGTDNPAKERTLTLVFSKLRSPNRDQTSVIWPFFSHVIDREKKYEEWQTPWPLVEFAHGEG